MPELYRCERMSAAISREQCKRNQRAYDCQIGCHGLAERVQLQVEEFRMASHRGLCETCGRPDAPLLHKSSSECHTCYKKRRAQEKQAESVAPVEVVTAVGIDAVAALGELDLGLDGDMGADDHQSKVWAPTACADLAREVLLPGDEFAGVPAHLTVEWRRRGWTWDHVLGLMELQIMGKLRTAA